MESQEGDYAEDYDVDEDSEQVQLQLLLSLLKGGDFRHFGKKLAFNHLPNLEWLDLRKSGLIELPEGLSDLSSLERLSLNGNEFESVAASELPLVQNIDVRHNKLSLSALNSLLTLPSLTRLDASSNPLVPKDAPTQPLSAQNPYLAHNSPFSIPPSTAKLQSLVLRRSYLQQFPGSLALSIATSLTHLDISDNSITALPPQIKRLTKLRLLNVSRNQLFKLSDGICELTELEHLICSQCELTSLPLDLPDLKKLIDFDISDNNLNGVPGEIQDMTQLVRLNLANNAISTIPPAFRKLKRLESLNMSRNKLAMVSGLLCSLTSLRRLLLNGNEITNRGIPRAISRLTRLSYLGLSKNLITKFPDLVLNLDHTTLPPRFAREASRRAQMIVERRAEVEKLVHNALEGRLTFLRNRARGMKGEPLPNQLASLKFVDWDFSIA